MKISRNNVSNYALIKFNETNYLIKWRHQAESSPQLSKTGRELAPPISLSS